MRTTVCAELREAIPSLSHKVFLQWEILNLVFSLQGAGLYILSCKGFWALARPLLVCLGPSPSLVWSPHLPLERAVYNTHQISLTLSSTPCSSPDLLFSLPPWMCIIWKVYHESCLHVWRKLHLKMSTLCPPGAYFLSICSMQPLLNSQLVQIEWPCYPFQVS